MEEMESKLFLSPSFVCPPSRRIVFARHISRSRGRFCGLGFLIKTGNVGCEYPEDAHVCFAPLFRLGPLFCGPGLPLYVENTLDARFVLRISFAWGRFFVVLAFR